MNVGSPLRPSRQFLPTLASFLKSRVGILQNTLPNHVRRVGNKKARRAKPTRGPRHPLPPNPSLPKLLIQNLRPRRKNPHPKILIPGENPNRPKVPNKLERWTTLNRFTKIFLTPSLMAFCSFLLRWPSKRAIWQSRTCFIGPATPSLFCPTLTN